MAESIGDLQLTVRINKETGELEVLKAQVSETSEKFNKLGAEAEGSGKQLDSLVGSLAKVASATAIITFIKDAIQEAVRAQEALRILETQMGALGLSFQKNEERIAAWVLAMQEFAHIEDDVVVAALGRTVQKVKDLDQAMKLVQLSQDIAVATGKDFEGTLDMLSRAAGGAERGLMTMRLEFGKQLEGVNSVQEAINKLGETYGGAAEKVDGFKYKSVDMVNQVGHRVKALGEDFVSTATWISDTFFAPLLGMYDRALITTKTFGAMIIEIFVGSFQIAGTAIANFGVVLYQLTHLHMKAAWDAIEAGAVETTALVKEHSALLVDIMKEGGKEQKALEDKRRSDKKFHFETVLGITAAATTKETSEIVSAMDEQMRAIKDKEALELSLADTTAATKLANANVNGSDDLRITQENTARKMQILNQAAADEITLINATKAKVNDEEFKSGDRILAVSQQLMLKQNKLRQDQMKADKAANDERAANFSSTLNVISTLASNKNKELAAIGKAAAIAQASIDTYAAANKALASAPPPWNFALAAMVVAAGLVNVAKIASFAKGGVMTGKGPSNLKRYSNGGIANSPQMAEFGEGDTSEAYVPLPDGRSIPVTLKMDSKGQGIGGGGVTSISVTFGDVNIDMKSVDSTNIDYFITQLTQRLGTETAQVIRLALSLKNLADKNERTAV